MANIIFNEVSSSLFSTLKYKSLFEDLDFDRKFGVITNGQKYFKFSWQSDLIDPDIQSSLMIYVR